MANLKIRLSIVATLLILVALSFGWLGPYLAQRASEQIQPLHLGLAAFIFVGLCGVGFYGMLERGLRPVLTLIDTFSRMRAGDLDPRIPVEGPEEMQGVARAFNEMIGDLELRIRDIEDEKQAAARGRQYLAEQLTACQQFKFLVDSAPSGILLADVELTVIYQNAASESGFVQLADFFPWNAEVIVGRPLPMLYSDEDEAREILSNPDRLPYETNVTIGPYKVRFLAGPVYDSDEDYVGPMLFWEVVGEEAQPEAMAEERTTGVEETIASAPEVEVAEEVLDAQLVVSNQRGETSNSMAVAGRVSRGATLVDRSVRLLSDRLSTVVSMVEALCSEGDNLHSCLEDARQRTQNTAYLASERSEALWELVDEMNGQGERTRASAMLLRRLQKGMRDVDSITASVASLADSIEHMVVEARLEAGRAGDEVAGIRAVVDEIQKLGRETLRVRKDIEKKLDRMRNEVDDVLTLLEEDRRETRTGGRLARKAESALGRIERDLTDMNERTNLLAEMAAGQSEIGSHIADQMGQLKELVNVTMRVAHEQARLTQASYHNGAKDPEVTVHREA